MNLVRQYILNEVFIAREMKKKFCILWERPNSQVVREELEKMKCTYHCYITGEYILPVVR